MPTKCAKTQSWKICAILMLDEGGYIHAVTLAQLEFMPMPRLPGHLQCITIGSICSSYWE